MSLSFLKEQFHDVHVQPAAFRHLDPVKRQGSMRGLADPQGPRLADWDEVGDGRVAVQHGDGLAGSHRPQVLAQPRFEVSNAYLLHGSIMTRSSHIDNSRGSPRHKPH